jgi:DNA modification methylase
VGSALDDTRTENLFDVYDVRSPALSADGIQSVGDLDDAGGTLRRLSDIPWEFTDEATSYLSHDLHPYPAKFIPQIPANLIAQLSVLGELVWDPFGGSGTTAVEAVLLGRRVLSTDANPLATLIGQAKTTTLSLDDEVFLQSLATELSLLAKDTLACQRSLTKMKARWLRWVPAIPNIEKWFSPLSVQELAYLRDTIEGIQSPQQRGVALVAFSRCVQKVSFQDSETRYSSKPRKVAIGEALTCFARELATCTNRVSQFGRRIGYRQATFITHNAMTPPDGAVAKLEEGAVDLVVTSPPYPNVTDYHLYHRFRMFWLGFDPREFGRVEIGSHLRHQRQGSEFKSYLSEMRQCLQNIHFALRGGRYASLVLGDGIFEGQTHSTSTELSNVAADVGFEVVGMLQRQIHKTRRSFVPPARRAREEQILILRKRPRASSFCLMPPNYKLHKYEEDLRHREVESIVGRKAKWADGLQVVSSTTHASRLRQLVFSHALSARNFSAERTWQAHLENGRSNGSKRKNSNYWLHGVHPYKGKFYPQLAGSLINISGISPGARLLDPYCGSGTSITEGVLKGFNSVGCDINPLAIKVARTKTRLLSVSPTLIDHAISRLLSATKRLKSSETTLTEWLQGYSVAAQTELIRWFPRPVLMKIGSLYREIRATPSVDLQELFEILLSSLVRDISQQDPKDLRIRLRHPPIKDADVIGQFSEQLESHKNKILRFFEIANAAPMQFGSSLVWEGDSRLSENFAAKLEKSSVDIVVSSPPYATALPYIDTYRLSHLLLFGAAGSDRRPLEQALTGSREITTTGRRRYEERIEAGDFAEINSSLAARVIAKIYNRNSATKVGFRRQNQAALLFRYFADLSATFAALLPYLAPKAQLFFVLGNNVTVAGGEEVAIDTVSIAREIGTNVGWSFRGEIPISVTTENLKHQKNAITRNAVLQFQA